MVKYKSKKTTRSFFLSFLLMSLPFVINAQGWSFQFNLAYAGNCGATPNIVLPTMPNNLFQTQAQCEAIRQQFLAIKESGGGCTVYYACTPCTGSDIIIPGQTNPGEISSSGQFEGKPLFTPHQSKAFEDWAKDYKQQLESYGIKSILGMSITPNNSIPSSGNAKVDKIYKDDVENFNPKSQPINVPNEVDLSKSSGKVGLLTTKEQQAERDKWHDEHGFSAQLPITDDQGLDENGKPLREIKEGVLRTLIGEAPGLIGVIGNFGLNVVDGAMETPNKAIGYLRNNDISGAKEYSDKLLDGGVAVNATKKTIIGVMTDQAVGVVKPILKIVPGAGYVYTTINFIMNVKENREP
jgi:hypothetical protein